MMSTVTLNGLAGTLSFWRLSREPGVNIRTINTRKKVRYSHLQLKVRIYYQNLMEKHIAFYTAAGDVKKTSALASTLQVQLLCLSVFLLPTGAHPLLDTVQPCPLPRHIRWRVCSITSLLALLSDSHFSILLPLSHRVPLAQQLCPKGSSEA